MTTRDAMREAKQEQMAAQRGCLGGKKVQTKPKAKIEEGDHFHEVLTDPNAHSLDDQVSAVLCTRKEHKEVKSGFLGFLGCGGGTAVKERDFDLSEDQVNQNLNDQLGELTDQLDEDDLWASWMRLYKAMAQARSLGVEDELPNYARALEQSEALGLTFDDTMDLEKVKVTDPSVVQTIQQLFDTCVNKKMADMMPSKLTVNDVYVVSHEQTRAEYLLRRQKLVKKCDELKASGQFELRSVPSQQVSLAGALGLDHEPVDADYNEFYLFHGTSDEVAEKITDTDFLIKTSADNGWTFGQGVYAAEWVNHAEFFATMGGGESSCTILVCRAFIGHFQDAGNWPNTAEPCEDPPVKDLEANIKDGTYMSTTGSEWPDLDYEVHDYIIPDDDQILPEFIVHCSIEDGDDDGAKQMLKDTFSEFDYDGDGKISPEDLKKAFVEMGCPQDQVEDEVEDFMKSFGDEDGDGKIDYHEFVAQYYKDMASDGPGIKLTKMAQIVQNDGAKQMLKDTFSEFDYDGDGKISPEDLKKVLAEMGCPEDAVDENVEDFFEHFGDEDGDGKIDYHEFVAQYYKDMASSPQKLPLLLRLLAM